MEAALEWAKNVFMLLIFLSFFKTLFPESELSKYADFIYSVIIMVILLQPLLMYLKQQ